MKWAILFSLTFLLVAGGTVNARPLSTDSPGFREALQAYDAGNYKESVAKLETLLKEGGENGELRYNLGDAYFRNKELGQSIYQFRKALELLPRDPDVKFNLGYVRNHAADKIEDKTFTRGMKSLVPLSLRESVYFLAVSSLLFWGVGLIALFRKERFWRQAQTAFLVVFLISIAAFAELKFGRRPFGVVISPAAEVYSGFGKDNVLLFTLHEGAEFTVGEAGSGDWVQIALADGKKGWVRKNDVVL